MSTLEDLKKTIKSDIERETPAIVVHDVIKEILTEKWVGKVLNKRIETQVKERLDALFKKDVSVYYSKGYSSHELAIWGFETDRGFEKRTVFYLARLGGCADPNYFDHDYDACHGSAAKDRNAKREELLNDEETLMKIAVAIDTVKIGWKVLNDLVGEYNTPPNVIEYAAIRMTGLTKDRAS